MKLATYYHDDGSDHPAVVFDDYDGTRADLVVLMLPPVGWIAAIDQMPDRRPQHPVFQISPALVRALPRVGGRGARPCWGADGDPTPESLGEMPELTSEQLDSMETIDVVTKRKRR